MWRGPKKITKLMLEKMIVNLIAVVRAYLLLKMGPLQTNQVVTTIVMNTKMIFIISLLILPLIIIITDVMLLSFISLGEMHSIVGRA